MWPIEEYTPLENILGCCNPVRMVFVSLLVL